MEVYLPKSSLIIEKNKVENLEKDSKTLGGISQLIKTGKTIDDIKKFLASKGYEV